MEVCKTTLESKTNKMERNICSLHLCLLTKPLLKTVDNCGKIIDKKRVNNLAISMDRKLIQHSESTKKVSPFLIASFKHHFSQVLAQLFDVNILTLAVINRLWITFI